MVNQTHHIPFATKQPIVWFVALLTFGFSLYGYPLATAGGSAPTPVPSVETVQFQSQLVNAALPYNVILPPAYRSASTTRYPVLYLLHGLSGHYTDWVTRTNISDYAAEYRLIIVMPEGNDSWYVDSSGVATDKYEAYILKELIPDVDKRFRTIQSRYGRAVAGLSMGGYGAVKYGLKYPSTFAFAASMSGAFGVTRYTQNEMGGSNWEPFFKIFGPVGSEARKANDVFEITRGLPASRVASLPFFYFDCGTEDAGRHVNANRELSQLFLEKKVPHEYRELPGNHSWEYWDQQVQEVLQIAAKQMRMPAIRKPGPRVGGQMNKPVVTRK
ncbi:MAG: putative tributyrin esterase [Blastocatellia bacterium]|jgi:S-formylglutathione hydrolase FrmB|nr:putative tributyrin esterase [Blastocatellia bacterium]